MGAGNPCRSAIAGRPANDPRRGASVADAYGGVVRPSHPLELTGRLRHPWDNQQIGQERKQEPDRESDDVGVLPVDPGHEGLSGALDGVAAGTSPPLLRADVPGEPGVVELAEGDLRDGRRRARLAGVLDHRHAADDLVGPAPQPSQRRPRLRRVAGLAEDPVVQRDDRVHAEDDRPGARDGLRLAQRVELGDGVRLAGGVLLDVRRLDRERHAELLEDRAPLRRAARED